MEFKTSDEIVKMNARALRLYRVQLLAIRDQGLAIPSGHESDNDYLRRRFTPDVIEADLQIDMVNEVLETKNDDTGS